MTEESRAAIRAAYEAGANTAGIAAAGGVSVEESETYLRWWCDRGCPGAFPGEAKMDD